ncbi:hypothetical protein VTL71DRAFT_9176 [Oculimacula yallundae]|uniref:Thioesterase domain-containing protein n=1 Tax=Oculimacula yallundae TaxID=86028 RepID=A0ABR4BSB3_9HELO
MASNPLTIQKRRSLTGNGVPLYLVHDGSGTVANYCKLGSLDCDVFGIQDPHFMTSEPWVGGMLEMAKHYVALIEKTTPRGKIVLGGWSFGGLVAVQLAHELRSHSTLEVQGIILMEAIYPSIPEGNQDVSAWPGLSAIRSAAVREKVTKSITQSSHIMDTWSPPAWVSKDLGVTLSAEARTSQPTVVLLRGMKDDVPDNTYAVRFNRLRKQPLLGWEEYKSGFITKVFEIEGSHLTLFETENASITCPHLRTEKDTLNDG